MPHTLPTSTEELTTEWMAEALAEKFPDAKLLDSRLVEAHSGTTGRARVEFSWSESGRDDLPSRAFLKLVPTNAVQRGMNTEMQMGKTEARFYKELAAEIPVRHPQAYYSDWSEDGSTYIIIIEDLESSGGRPARLPYDNDYAYAEQIIDELAVLHARYWNSERFNTDLSWVTPYWPYRASQIPGLIDRCYRLMGDLLPPVHKEARDLFCEHQYEICDYLDSGVPTLVHGDGHMSNMYFDAEGRLGFIDWAIVSKMPAMWDVAMLCISFPPEVRRKIDNNLLPRYIDQLAERGGPVLDSNEVRRDYRKYAYFSWISAATTLGAAENMQPLEWGMAATQWTTKALEELDVIPLLREDLGL